VAVATGTAVVVGIAVTVAAGKVAVALGAGEVICAVAVAEGSAWSATCVRTMRRARRGASSFGRGRRARTGTSEWPSCSGRSGRATTVAVALGAGGVVAVGGTGVGGAVVGEATTGGQR
jgi:hypothetical protein